MNIAIKSIIGIIMLIILLNVISDVNTSIKVKSSLFNSLRSANQNSLTQLNGQVCSDTLMLETWLANFIYSYDLTLDEIEIEFYLVQDNPKIYIVKATGYEPYCFINEETYFSYVSSSTIIED